LPERILIYSVAIRQKFEKFPTQIVLFVGKGNSPPSVLKSEFTIHKFKVVDMKKIDPDEFIRSNKPEEVIVGILAGKYKEKPKIIKKVKKRIVEIVKNEKEIIKYIDSISFLAGLFDVEIEIKPMPIEVDIRKTFLYKWGKEEGEKEGLKEAILLGVQIKFGKSKVREVRNLLEKVDDVDHLKKIKRKITEVKTWDDFIKIFRNHKRNKFKTYAD
jgi:predicted transposase YdaD